MYSPMAYVLATSALQVAFCPPALEMAGTLSWTCHALCPPVRANEERNLHGRLQVPMVFAVCLCGLLPSYALLVGPSSWGSFPLVLLVCTANLWAFECIAQFFSLVSNPLLGMLQCLSVWIWSLQFCGRTARALTCH